VRCGYWSDNDRILVKLMTHGIGAHRFEDVITSLIRRVFKKFCHLRKSKCCWLNRHIFATKNSISLCQIDEGIFKPRIGIEFVESGNAAEHSVFIQCRGSERAFFATLVGGDLEPLHPIPKRALHAPALEHPTIVIPGSGSQRDDLPIKGQDDERAETTTGWRN
jgi:hypothetical protein